MRIEVTQADIKRGIRDSCQRCPIALAMFRATGEAWSVDAAVATKRVGFCTIFLPPVARKFIADFDHRKPVKPFSFEVELTGETNAEAKD